MILYFALWAVIKETRFVQESFYVLIYPSYYKSFLIRAAVDYRSIVFPKEFRLIVLRANSLKFILLVSYIFGLEINFAIFLPLFDWLFCCEWSESMDFNFWIRLLSKKGDFLNLLYLRDCSSIFLLKGVTSLILYEYSLSGIIEVDLFLFKYTLLSSEEDI